MRTTFVKPYWANDGRSDRPAGAARDAGLLQVVFALVGPGGEADAQRLIAGFGEHAHGAGRIAFGFDDADRAQERLERLLNGIGVFIEITRADGAERGVNGFAHTPTAPALVQGGRP